MTRGRAWLYGLPALAAAGPTYFVGFYLLNFSTDVLLLAPGVVGTLFGVCRLWDAISDPLVGYWSDRTRSRWGRRRPWITGSAPIVGLAFWLLWSPPAAFADAALLFWLAACLLLFFSATTAWGIPHQALGSELDRQPRIRTQLYAWRYASSLVGILASFGAMQWIVTAPEPRQAAALLASVAGVGIAAVLCIPGVALREPVPETSPQQRPAFRSGRSARAVRAFQEVARSADGRRLFAAGFFSSAAMGAQGVVAPYMVLYLLDRPDLMGTFPAFFIGPLIASIPAWVWIARSCGRRRTWIGSLCLGVPAYLLLYRIQGEDLVLAALLLALAGIASACSGPIGPSILASVIDEDERRTGHRKDGSFFSVWEFAEKAAGALVVVVVAAVLELVGFRPNAAQGPLAETGIRACLSFLPAGLLTMALVCVTRLRSVTEESPLP